MEGHTGRMWQTICGLGAKTDDSALDGNLVLDIGCGPGRFIEAARNRGASVIGIDFSVAADAAARNFTNDHNVCIIQGDALNLPFAAEVFDAAFSIGVLHHTPNPPGGVVEAYRVLKRTGWLAISVYGKTGYYKYPNVQAWRKVFAALWPYFSYRPALIYTYLTVTLLGPISAISRTLGRLFKIPFPFISMPDRNWSLLDTFDSITPSYQSGHESYEVFTWFKNSGFRDIEPTNWGSTSWRGIKLIPPSNNSAI
jgi:SAM-dependent methyltransferase